MKYYYNLLIAFVCLEIMRYHCIVNAEVLEHPYMVGLMIFLGMATIINLVITVYKFFFLK